MITDRNSSAYDVCYPLCEARVELSYLSHIVPADLLLHDAVEIQFANLFGLPPGH